MEDVNHTGKIWLSILVPVYDVRPYVKQCLSSILDQTRGRHDVELIILDDCSRDGSLGLCQQILSKESGTIRILRHSQNRGLSAARNSMLGAARGEYVWFVDSDDAILPGAVSRLHDITAAFTPDVIIADYVREEEEVFRTFRGEARKLLHSREMLIQGSFANRRLHAWSKIWKRELFGDTIRFPEGARYEDIATIPWLLLKAASFYYANEPWIYYRSRGDSIMARVNNSRMFDKRGNDDLAHALDGFRQALATEIPDRTPATALAISRFIAREYVKIVKRLFQSRKWRILYGCDRNQVRNYRAAMEMNSPLPFSTVALLYIGEGKLIRAVALYLAIALK